MRLNKQQAFSLLLLPTLLLAGCSNDGQTETVVSKIEKTVEKKKELSELEKKIQNEELRAIDVMRLYDVKNEDSFEETSWKQKIESVDEFKVDFERLQGRLIQNGYINPNVRDIDSSMSDSLKEFTLNAELMTSFKRFKELRELIHREEALPTQEEEVEDFYKNREEHFVTLNNELVDFEETYAGNEEMQPLERIVYEVIADSYWAFLAGKRLSLYHDENFRTGETGDQSVIKGMNRTEEHEFTYHFINLQEISKKLEEAVMEGW